MLYYCAMCYGSYLIHLYSVGATISGEDRASCQKGTGYGAATAKKGGGDWYFSYPLFCGKPVDIQELEASLYSQRQLVLQELELIRQREDHLIKQSELNKLQFSDLHSTSERLKQDEQILKTYVLTVEILSYLRILFKPCDLIYDYWLECYYVFVYREVNRKQELLDQLQNQLAGMFCYLGSCEQLMWP